MSYWVELAAKRWRQILFQIEFVRHVQWLSIYIPFARIRRVNNTMFEVRLRILHKTFTLGGSYWVWNMNIRLVFPVLHALCVSLDCVWEAYFMKDNCMWGYRLALLPANGLWWTNICCRCSWKGLSHDSLFRYHHLSNCHLHFEGCGLAEGHKQYGCTSP